MTETENSMYAAMMTLVVRKLQKSDMGGYKCISKNSIGDAEGTIRLYGKHKSNKTLNWKKVERKWMFMFNESFCCKKSNIQCSGWKN